MPGRGFPRRGLEQRGAGRGQEGTQVRVALGDVGGCLGWRELARGSWDAVSSRIDGFTWFRSFRGAETLSIDFTCPRIEALEPM